jgi:hypothetical protein
MKNKKNAFNKLILTLSAAALLFTLLSTSGCSVVNLVKIEGPPSNAEIISGYYGITLKVSSATDSLDEILLPGYELPSQTKRIIAASGQKKGGYKSWLKVAAFDENEKAAKRKYLVIEDEKPKTLFAQPLASAYIECQMVIDKELQDAPYANQPAKLLAILNGLQKKAAGDIAEVSADNKTIRLCGGLLNQALSAAITHLESSPAQTAQLNSSRGVNFSHLSLNEGKIQMGIDYDIATVQIKLGSYVKKWKLRFEKEIEKEEPVW